MRSVAAGRSASLSTRACQLALRLRQPERHPHLVQHARAPSRAVTLVACGAEAGAHCPAFRLPAPPHPHAAALLIDWTLSEEGQSLLAGLGYVVARKGVKQSLPALLEKESFLADPDFIGPILEETGRDFRNVFTGGR